jgi:hypothetical protein
MLSTLRGVAANDPHDPLELLRIRIAKCEDRYLDDIEVLPAPQAGGDERVVPAGGDEQVLLDALDQYVSDLIEAFNFCAAPQTTGRAGDLTLAPMYNKWTEGDDAWARLRIMIRAYLVTEIERRGMFRLHRAQQMTMAAHYEEIGAEFGALGFHRHAKLAYEFAAELYRILQENEKRDRCLLQMERAKHRDQSFGFASLVESFSDRMCGYGYQPYKLLRWMAIQVLAFTAVVWGLSTVGFVVSVHACLVDFLNPLGLGDVGGGFRGAAAAALVAESWAGSISMSVFFALLVRKWFQA